MTQRVWVVAAVFVLAVSAAALARATSATTDGTGRAIGYWEAYTESQVPYAPYTVSTTDGTGRAIGYWEAYTEHFAGK